MFSPMTTLGLGIGCGVGGGILVLYEMTPLLWANETATPGPKVRCWCMGLGFLAIILAGICLASGFGHMHQH